MRGINIEKRRHQLYRVVKPSRFIKIYYKTSSIDVYATGYVETCEVSNFEEFTSGQISILCPDIYWYSTVSQMAYYSYLNGAFTFPFSIDDKGVPLGKYNYSQIFTVTNEGDETGFTLEITAHSEWENAASTFTIYNTDTDEYLQITGQIMGGDVITITTKTGNKTITLDRNGERTNIINRLVSGSTWLTMREGKNRFLMCLLERRIIHPTYSATTEKSYSEIVKEVISQNCMNDDNRKISGLFLGEVSGECWEKMTALQISYANLMEWVYTICEKIGGTANIRLKKLPDEKYEMVFDLYQGTDRSMLQAENPHVIFSDAYSNLLSFTYVENASVQRNFAYIFGQGKGEDRKRTTYYSYAEPEYLDRYELYVDADDIAETVYEDGETIPIPEEKYIELLKTRGSERLILPQTASESEIAPKSTQYVYNKDYFVGDYVTVQHKRFGLTQEKIQLVGMIEAFDKNGRSLTPTFRKG